MITTVLIAVIVCDMHEAGRRGRIGGHTVKNLSLSTVTKMNFVLAVAEAAVGQFHYTEKKIVVNLR